MIITTTLGDMDDALLQRYDSTETNAEQRLDVIEYCVRGCEGRAHQTGVAQGDGCFCERHVHRSIDITIIRWPEFAGAVAQGLT